MVFAKTLCLRCITNSYVLKKILLLFPLMIFYILIITHLNQTASKTKYSLNHRLYNVFRQKQHKSSRFPLVREFIISPRVKKFDNEQARIIGFPDVNYSTLLGEQKTKIIYLATPYFSEWNAKHYYSLHLGNAAFTRYECPVSECYVTKNPSDINKAHAVLFHMRDLEIFNFQQYRSPQQLWIIYSMEPPWLEMLNMKRLNGIFNWTMSYRGGSDILVNYGFIGQKDEDSEPEGKLPNFSHKVNKAVWYVSNCRTDGRREEYVERLMQVYPVDVVGGCGKEGCRPAETRECYNKISSHYKFYLAFENAICKNYVTEKLFNPLEYYIIPVVFGGANYSKITPEKSIINAMDFSTPEELGKHLWKISQNETLYNSYFEWKNIYRSYLQPWMCDLCTKLHQPIVPKTNNDIESWWNEEKSCMRWTGGGFKPVEKYAFPEYHTHIFI